MNTKDQNEINIGIDASQAMPDTHVRPIGAFQSFENNPKGIRSAIRFIKQFKPTRVLIEATGRLEMAFFCAAHPGQKNQYFSPIRANRLVDLIAVHLLNKL